MIDCDVNRHTFRAQKGSNTYPHEPLEKMKMPRVEKNCNAMFCDINPLMNACLYGLQIKYRWHSPSRYGSFLRGLAHPDILLLERLIIAF